jgi:hypothetical protein
VKQWTASTAKEANAAGIGRIGDDSEADMTRRVSDEREHRRGLVLGLTLAEVLLLLMFLLLLALGSQVERYKLESETSRHDLENLTAAMDSLKPLQEALARGDSAINSVDELIQRLARAQKLESSLAQLKEENASLATQAAMIKTLGPDPTKKLQEVAVALDRASQLDPNNPLALMKRALEIIARLGTSTQPEQVKPLSEMMADATLKQRNELLEADREKIRLERDNLMHSGNGLTYPSCWVAQNGQTEYIFDVTTKDGGLIVKDVTFGSRSRDPAIKYIDALQKGVLISERTFNDATNRLFAYSKQQNCRFYTILRDDTGRESKERYKQLRAIVENHFYIMIPRTGPAADSRRDQPTAQASPKEGETKGGITLGPSLGQR